MPLFIGIEEITSKNLGGYLRGIEEIIFEEVQTRFCMYPTEWPDPLIWPVPGFQSVSDLDSILNGKPAKEFTFRQRPRFPYNGFEVACCAYELGAW